MVRRIPCHGASRANAFVLNEPARGVMQFRMTSPYTLPASGIMTHDEILR